MVATLLLILAAARSADAQPAPPATASVDVIGTLLQPQTARDEDEPDTAGQPRAAPRLSAPVRVDETGKTPDADPTTRDAAYDTRLRASFASAQGFQGPLDGGWTLMTPGGNGGGGGDLYALQLVDRADRLEGVWRDLRRKGSLNGSGLIDNLQRQGRELSLGFTPEPGATGVVATLHAGDDGRWTGELAEGGSRRPVVLRRTGP
ncbi:hypothetical protein [Phenylobacterium sp.]|uniref:hypothetical protein n=1 Tax=Phenylobacterium sp. TaxID=1871053 RepID=UPI00286AB541|nr:hypothetical protein [Phenylobacterium sp.]